MIHLTRINHEPIVINADLIEHIENASGTVISLTNEEKIRVLEDVDEIIERVVCFRRRIAAPCESPVAKRSS